MKIRLATTILASLVLLSYSTFSQEHQKQPAVNAAEEHMRRTSVAELIRNFESPERDAYQMPDKVMRYLGNVKGKTIMDLGAGSGYFSVRLAAKGAKVIAADVSDDFQNYLTERIAKDGIKNIELRKVPYDSPALKDSEVDMVLIVNTYHHIEGRSDYFAKVRKGTKRTGELVIIDFFKTSLPVGPKPDHKVSIDEAIAELKRAGYSSFDVNVTLLPYQYLIQAR